MSESERAEDSTAQRISALVDGELPATEVVETCRNWRADPQVRADWHAYNLIGDVLRSADLARPAARDQAFLGALRERLAQEPIVLAPTPPERPQPQTGDVASAIAPDASASITPLRPRRPRWVTPVGIAAGVAMVAGLAWTMRPPAPDRSPQMATLALPPSTAEPERIPHVEAVAALSPDTREQLEPYLNAHRMVPAKAAFGPAPGFMRSVAHEPGAR